MCRILAVLPAKSTYCGGRRRESVTCAQPSVGNVFKVGVFVRVF